jgi:hypothetical protein
MGEKMGDEINKKTCRCFGEINTKIIVVISSLVNGSLFTL